MSIGLVDLDIVVYKIGSACDNTYHDYKGKRYESKRELNLILKQDEVSKEDEKVLVTKGRDPESFDECKKTIVTYVEELYDTFDKRIGFISGKGNFRYKVATIKNYKGNRSKVEKPFHYDNIRQFLCDAYGAKVSVGYEADDAIGLAHLTEDSVIATTDKDLNCIPGLHFNWDTGVYFNVTELESYQNFFSQVLMGDTTDNILGLFNVGKKSPLIKKIHMMEDVNDMIDLVRNEYSRRFGNYSETFFKETAMLVWILQNRENPLVSGEYWK